jgi:hypothetical protein
LQLSESTNNANAFARIFFTQMAVPPTLHFAILALFHEKALKTQHVVNQKFVASNSSWRALECIL